MTAVVEVSTPTPALLAGRISRLGTENAFKVGPMIRAIEDAGHRVLKCNLGEPDFPLPSHITEEIKRQLDAGMTHYTDPQGVPAFREAIARDMGARRGLEITPDRVVVFPGAKTPIGFCQEAYCDPGDEVVYPSPGFPIYESFTRYLGAVPVPYHLDEESGWEVRADALARLIGPRTKLLILNFPSNPTGGVARKEQLQEIADVIVTCGSPDLRVYSDEVYERILFDGAAHSSIASLPGMESRTVIVSGASKTYAFTGGRVGWAVFPTPQEADTFRNLNINYFSCVPPFVQLGLKLALESPESDVAIDKMVEAFQERRRVVISGLNRIEGIRCQWPRGAFYAFPNVAGACERLGAIEAFEKLPAEVRARTSPSTLLQRFLLLRYHVATLDRRSFGAIGAEGRHYLRISIATGLADLEEALHRLAAAVADRAGFEAFLRSGQAF